ncbi:hypothetical protein BGX33_008950 [Mortierella sp. NVP41]|nr:hypothetical protein BGX33_008950 [Mortierella sp. NVP41]
MSGTKPSPPSLWRSIDDSTHSWPYILGQITNPRSPTTSNDTTNNRDSDLDKDRDWLLVVFKKYGQHIRDLKIQCALVLDAASQGCTCTELHSLVLKMDGQQAEGPPLVPLPRPPPVLRQPILGFVGGFGGFGGAGPVAGVAGFGNAQAGGTDAAGTAVPVAGGFGVPLVPLTVNFGAASVLSQETTLELVNGLSEALFPDHLTKADVRQRDPFQQRTEESRQARISYEWIHAQHLWHLIRINPGLVRLDITRNCLPVFVSIPGEFYYATIASLKKLRELKIFSPSIELEFWRLLELLPPGIESLSIGYELFPLPDPLPEINPNLRSLSARGNTTIAGLHELLGIFPNLETLELDCIANDSGSTGHQLPPPPFEGHSLRRLQTETEEMLNEEVTLYLRERMPQIESFRTTHQPQYIDEGRPESDPANQFLVTNRHLKEFDSIQHHLWVDDMLRQPWACMGLEWLTCRIVGVDRLFPEEEDIVTRVMATGYSVELSAEESGAVEKFNRCRAQHHGVYDRLASLTRLKHLDFGYENRYIWTSKSEEYYTAEDGEEYLEYNGPVFDTLELTLESGLGRLAALRDLEMFGFECVNHRIGRAELDWMAKSWPKLKLMYGLDRERLYIEPSKERAALRKYFLELRPDVVHDSLFVDNV